MHVDVPVLAECQRQAETMRQQIMWSDAQLATCQRYLSVDIAALLAVGVCSTVLACYMGSWLWGHKRNHRALRNAVLLGATVVTALALLLFAERHCWDSLAQL